MLRFPHGVPPPAPPFGPGVFGKVPVGVDGFGEERLVRISAGLRCDPLVRVVS